MNTVIAQQLDGNLKTNWSSQVVNHSLVEKPKPCLIIRDSYCILDCDVTACEPPILPNNILHVDIQATTNVSVRPAIAGHGDEVTQMAQNRVTIFRVVMSAATA